MRVQIAERIADYNLRRMPGEPEMTQRRLAAYLGVTEGAVSLWMNRKRPVPLRAAFDIARLLGCGVDELFEPETLHDVNRAPDRRAP